MSHYKTGSAKRLFFPELKRQHNVMFRVLL